MTRDCAECGRTLPQSSYTANQYSKGAGVSRCAAFVDGLSTDSPPRAVGNAGRHNTSSHAIFTTEDLDNPFASGAFRWVAKGEYTNGPREGQPCVAKWFKTGVVFSQDFFLLDIKAVDKSLDIVNKFNEFNIASKAVVINVPEVWEFSRQASSNRAGSKTVTEPYIENYVKFNSNSGWTDSSQGWPEIMQALSHFSYHITGGNFVLCDLQGGIYQQHVVLSHPVILSRNREYGVTDLGPDGISTFFSQHRSNLFCRSDWTAPVAPRQILRVVPGTTMMGH
ncbi:kinase-like domain-containing protein [Rhypophila decipiens]|uniref:Kinase-like domain-containing protein n=1 Tax=Rhypophila decipiens TaxID=261697 RepID=A0AAN7B7R2_9PEZI|nr:kinase-like domain-containing protein [Rhypophila decipiens]